jgi:hypothetical protein
MEMFILTNFNNKLTLLKIITVPQNCINKTSQILHKS